MMKAFRVWVRPLDYEYMVCVDGMDNARWLLDQLAGSFIFRSAQPINEEHNSTLCTFQVPSNSQLPFARFQRALAAIPEVTLLRAAAATTS
jgi:hypothetical protein